MKCLNLTYSSCWSRAKLKKSVNCKKMFQLFLSPMQLRRWSGFERISLFNLSLLSNVQGARAKMAQLFGCIFWPYNGYFIGTFWYLWKALCMHFQKLVLASPYYSIWRSYGWITEATSIFPVLFFCQYQDKLTTLGLCNCLSGLLQVDSEDYCSIVIKKQK